MPRKVLLATTAGAALLAAASLGAAQDTRQGGPGGANSMHSQTQGVGAQEDHGQGGAAAQENRGRGEQRGDANTRMQSGQKSDREMGAGRGSTERNEQMGAGNKEQRNDQRSEEKTQSNDRRSEENMQRRDQRSEENMQRRDQRGETTGERNREHSGVKHEGVGPGRAQSNEGINPRNGPDHMQNKEGMGQRSEQGGGRFESARSVKLSNQQRTKIRETFTHEHVQRVDHPDFALRVGTPVPRDVQLYDVPEDIVVLVPQYRGLKYIIVRNEVVFLDPDTLEIVAIMPA
jgi:Protein of unknown function (DUF1236)